MLWSRALRGVIIFTVIEIVTLVVWLILAGVPFSGKVFAVIVLAVGLFIEHYVSAMTAAVKNSAAARHLSRSRPSTPVRTAPSRLI